MPKIYRVMYASTQKPEIRGNEERPEIGSGKSKLGVRPGEIKADQSGDVYPQPNGMSVFVCPCQIIKNIVPGRLQSVNPQLFRGAIGDDDTFIWRTGTGSFFPGPLNDVLQLEADPRPARVGRHGTVGPQRVMRLKEYEDALASTQDNWNIDEQRNRFCPYCSE